MSYPLVPQEEATIRAFIVRARRDRFLELLPNPKKRSSITKSLAHPNPGWFDSRYVKAIPPAQSHAPLIAKLLRSKGAGEKCWAISEDVKLDGREVELDSILPEIVGYGIGRFCAACPANSHSLKVRTVGSFCGSEDSVPHRARRAGLE
jgi:hypothetical protein